MHSRILKTAPLSIALVLAALSGCGTPYSQQETVTLTAESPSARFVMNNRVGDITIKSDPAAPQVSASVTKIGRGSSPDEARKALQEIKVSLARTETTGVIEAKSEHPNGNGFRNYCVTWNITMPPSPEMIVKNNVGDVRLDGVSGTAEVRTNVGDAIVKGLPNQIASSGPVKVTTHVGDAHAENIGNGIRATTDVGDIHASGGGPVYLQSDVGDVHLRLTGHNMGAVDCSADVGDVVVYLPKERRGSLDASSDVGDTVVNLGPIPMQNITHRRKYFYGDLGGASEPSAKLRTDVGSVTVRSASEQTPAVN